ncbi:MAG: ribosome biogenesis GTPase Der [Planctomycetota bacterium]|nr:MAG: ribosome biogenesis GTPase Der [Planctomycetota bacterium]REJ88297.1 MAG: ribosome biogenesis GTPase Der [Planctomycetota bacterium]REK22944.1 MAG: ribosome biogenesis GTPase Der [Planctomycetota bacterium]REK44747.1 MAG: ribosome biogenesis GTPase Der [Planctomycetota bacterium]
MALPQVVIVGRPNTGKSSLFNWLVGKRLAIVDPTAGVTRDRMSYLLCHEGRYFELVDTGGMGINDVDDLTAEIEEQIDHAIESADVVLFVVDAQAGLMSHDAEVAQRLRYIQQPIICVANKADVQSMDAAAAEFYRLGRGKLICTSTKQNRNRTGLLDMIVDRLPAEVDPEDEPAEAILPEMRVALVGRRNTGKSTFINTLVNAERMIVSEVPGTTRDSVDVRFELDGKAFIAIDTPGVKRGKAIKTDLDFYSLHRAQRSIRRADVVLIFFDPTQRISKVDRQLCDYVTDQYKPCIFVVNKWDLMADSMPTEKWVTYLHDTFRTMQYAPIAFITGQTGKNVKALLNHGQMLFKQTRERVTTGRLNRLVAAAVAKNPPPIHKGRPAKVYYATQVGVQPPTLVLFCNNPSAFSQPYRRYLLKVFRDNLPFAEVPIKLYLRKREPGDSRDEIVASPAAESVAENDVAPS